MHTKIMRKKRAAYAAFEQTVLDLYDQELLTLNRLDQVAHQYRWLEVGSAGGRNLLTCDGKDLYQVCIELVDPFFLIPARGSSEDHEESWEKELRKWEDIVRWRWGWRAYSEAMLGQWQRDEAA